MPVITNDELIEVQSMIQKLKKQEILPKAKTKKLIEGLRKDLHRLVIETEGLIAVSTEKLRSKANSRGEMSRTSSQRERSDRSVPIPQKTG